MDGVKEKVDWMGIDNGWILGLAISRMYGDWCRWCGIKGRF